MQTGRCTWELYGPLGPPKTLLEKARFLVRVVTKGFSAPFVLRNRLHCMPKGKAEMVYVRETDMAVILHHKFIVMVRVTCLKEQYLGRLRREGSVKLPF